MILAHQRDIFVYESKALLRLETRFSESIYNASSEKKKSPPGAHSPNGEIEAKRYLISAQDHMVSDSRVKPNPEV